MVKQFERFENTREIMMVRLDEENASSAAIGVCDRNGNQQLLLQNES